MLVKKKRRLKKKVAVHGFTVQRFRVHLKSEPLICEL